MCWSTNASSFGRESCAVGWKPSGSRTEGPLLCLSHLLPSLSHCWYLFYSERISRVPTVQEILSKSQTFCSIPSISYGMRIILSPNAYSYAPQLFARCVSAPFLSLQRARSCLQTKNSTFFTAKQVPYREELPRPSLPSSLRKMPLPFSGRKNSKLLHNAIRRRANRPRDRRPRSRRKLGPLWQTGNVESKSSDQWKLRVSAHLVLI